MSSSSGATSQASDLKYLYCVLLSLPVHGSETSGEVYRAHAQRTGDLGASSRLDVPDLPVGTLDALMNVSDELAKVDTAVEGVCRKVVQTLTELLEQPQPQWTVAGAPPDRYIASWAWDEKKYPWRTQLRETVARISAQVQRLDADLRAKSTAYTTLARALAAESRKDGGTLATRSLHDVVRPDDLVETEYLTTLLVVVPRHAYREWAAQYERLTEFVLPRSGRLLREDAESGLYAVTLFRRVADDYRNAARERRFTVRDVDRESLSARAREEREKRLAEKNALEAKLVRWCKINFGEVFAAWVHVKAVRVYVESVLRYGLPPRFVIPVLRPTRRDEKRVMTALAKTYADLGPTSAATLGGGDFGGGKESRDDADIPPISGAANVQEKFYPFVYATINIDLVRTSF